MIQRLRRLWWLELVIVLIAVTALSRLGNGDSARTQQASQDQGHPLVLRFMIYDRQDRPIPGARVQIWHPDAKNGAAPRAFEGEATTSDEGEATLYSVVPRKEDRRVLYTVRAPGHPELPGVIRLPDRPGTREFQAPHALVVSEDRNGLIWRGDVYLALP